MKKPPTLSQQLEFARLRAFVVAGYEHVLADLPAMPETHPGDVADKMWAEGADPRSAACARRQPTSSK